MQCWRCDFGLHPSVVRDGVGYGGMGLENMDSIYRKGQALENDIIIFGLFFFHSSIKILYKHLILLTGISIRLILTTICFPNLRVKRMDVAQDLFNSK